MAESKSDRVKRSLTGLVDLNDRSTSHFDDVVRRFTQHPWQNPNSILSDAETRRQYAINIRNKIRLESDPNYKMTLAHLAVILVAPLAALQPEGNLSSELVTETQSSDSGPIPASSLLNTLNNTWHFVHRFMQEDQTNLFKKAVDSSRASSGRPHTDGSLPKKKKAKKRTGNERDECFHRDGQACIVMRTSDPDVCHILPYSFNSSEENARETEIMFGATKVLMSPDFFQKYLGIIANPKRVGGSDKSWNLVNLNMQLHRWWGMAFWGFKPVDARAKDPAHQVTLQWHWMPRVTDRLGPGGRDENKRYPRDDVQLEGDDTHVAKLVSDINAFDAAGQPSPLSDGTGNVQAFLPTGELVQSGHLFKVTLPSEEYAQMFREMMDLQWACITLFRLKGGAGPEDLPTLNNDDNDDSWKLPIKKWLDNIVILLTAEAGSKQPSPDMKSTPSSMGPQPPALEPITAASSSKRLPVRPVAMQPLVKKPVVRGGFLSRQRGSPGPSQTLQPRLPQQRQSQPQQRQPSLHELAQRRIRARAEAEAAAEMAETETRTLPKKGTKDKEGKDSSQLDASGLKKENVNPFK
ncbi:uncharacterized protein FTJAE_12141 [Fusarium tjaetaba]|uniref:HNH nuclease domain-containing protein n=1 Tax=Fusarium tjaetaba TaxID=1567544 RepID=A0A8H5QP72_9HYPO|nr:uncharacterized protein FTJAE_12141 [Fusarium tjaetaba]KAF5618780.1 hypothetical protein FTJAE_12141 [Fusarium tjaetaba]